MTLVTILYVLLILSVFLNLRLFIRVHKLEKDIKRIRGGVELSKEELRRIRSRISKMRG
jgi:hypothetical protein